MTELPKQALLLKLLRMTTSDNDGEALTAMRKANELLASAGWDWEKLLAGKIVMVGDPFGNVAVPEARRNNSSFTSPPPPAPPPRPAPMRPAPAPPRSTPPPPSSWGTQPSATVRTHTPPRQRTPISSLVNRYGGGCWCCGDTVDVGEGFAFKPKDFNSAIKMDKYFVICTSCNSSRVPSDIYRTFAPRTYQNAHTRAAQSAPPPSLNSL